MAIETPLRRHNRLTMSAVAVFALVMVAGCSSDAKKSDAEPKEKKTVVSSTSSSTAAPTSSTSAPSGAPCTVEAATAALSAESATATSIVCGAGWASGGASNAEVDLAYLLHDVDGEWTNEGTDSAEMDEACAADNPLGIPENVLDGSPCKVS